MPRNQKYRKRNRKGRKQRKGKKRNSNTTIQRQLVIADRQFVKLQYNNYQHPALQITSGTQFAYDTYKMNGLVEVSNADDVVSVIPGFSEWAGFYARYRVHAVKITCQPVNVSRYDTALTSPVPTIYFVMHAQTDPAPGTVTSWSQWRILSGNRYSRTQQLGGAAGNGTGKKQSLYIDMARFSGSKTTYLSDLDYTGVTPNISLSTSGTDPSQLFLCYIAALTGTPVNVPAATWQGITYDLTIKYYVEFFERIDDVTN